MFWNYQADNTKCPDDATSPTLFAVTLLNTDNEIVFSNYVVLELTDGPLSTINEADRAAEET